MPYRSAAEHEDVPRPVVGIGNDYPPSFELAEHRHRRGQLLYAANGVVAVSTPQGAWVAPPERAVWIPGGTPHAVRMVGAVQTRSVLIEPSACPALGAPAASSRSRRCCASSCCRRRKSRWNMTRAGVTGW